MEVINTNLNGSKLYLYGFSNWKKNQKIINMYFY
jgi:hypothetical protein